MTRRRALWLHVAILVVLLVVWEVLGRYYNPVIFAGPARVVDAAIYLVRSGELFPALRESTVDLLMGFCLAVAVGVPVGLAAGRSRVLDAMLSPYFAMLLTAPLIALGPLILFGFGIGTFARVVLTFIFSVPYVLVNSAAGARSVDPQQIEMARSFGLDSLRRLRLVVLPAAMPAVFSGLRLGLGNALTGVIVGELLVSPVGLGGLLASYQVRYRTDVLFATILVISLLVIILFWGLRRVESRVCSWVPRLGGAGGY
jgi:ABC-type nitrate/sulfonate/bicarbonate transport system permease component